MSKPLEGRIWVLSPEFINSEQEWIKSQIKEIGEETLSKLASRSAQQRELSYSPYSHYQVGVALLTNTGNVYGGANVERATQSETDHGEESAVTAAVLGGEIEKSGRKFIKALAVSHDSDTAPCGRCRQIMIEHCDNALIMTVDPQGEIRYITSLKLMLPYAFSPTDLGIE